MPPETPAPEANMAWLLFAILAFASWGIYGVVMHAAGVHMGAGGADPYARYKAYIFVGVAYLFVAVLAPIVVLIVNGASWKFPGAGIKYSLFAGVLGALGAFFVLSAMGSVAKRPWMIAVVMCVVFAGAPIINAIVAMIVHPPTGGLKAISPLFFVGILMAAVGAGMATYFKPKPPKKEPAIQQPANPAPAGNAATPSGNDAPGSNDSGNSNDSGDSGDTNKPGDQ
jgi:ABC-type transport system involved in multi-copper enzyme maturation permease subunit